ncbi:hypothetical protein [Gemmata sp.]|uniref:hypothetical protein n=1 Tax=Gemmata sp. TaxID=1914242 RepID=UPI003F72FEBE
MPRRKFTPVAGLAVATLVSVLVVALGAAWWNRPGCYSGRNYERIEKGMTLEQVEALLGKPGEEVPDYEIPRGRPRGEPPDPTFGGDVPGSWCGGVWGDPVYRWWKTRPYVGAAQILVGVSGGRVISKYRVEHFP